MEARLGNLVDNPLLFVMALSLAKTGVHAETRGGLFERFVEGLAARPGGEALTDLVFALVRDACFDLRERDLYASDQWTWRRLLGDGLGRLAEQRMFDTDAISSNEALERAQTGGLLRVVPSSGVLALTHDLFCDFFAAEAVRLGQRALPEVVGESLEELAVFLADRGALDPGQAAAVTTNPVAAARGAASTPLTATIDEEEVTELFARLSTHLGPDWRKPLVDLHIRALHLADGVYIFALPSLAYPAGAQLDPDGAADAALRVARVSPGSSSLAAAVALWLAELRSALTGRNAGTLLPIPTDRDKMPAALEAAFRARKLDVEALCADVCPSLAERVQRDLGLRGFHAVVLPQQSFTLPIGGGTNITAHPVVFSFNASDISVRVADAAEDDFIENPSAQMACEDWLRDSPAQAALNDVQAVLANLLPGLAK